MALADIMLVVLMASLAYCMMNPIRWDGPGKFGAAALYFPPHLLLATLVGLGLLHFQ